ncbi:MULTISPECIES: hypothetical protein [unclassified Streptomyces]|uniref:hypothetical protein n=1 Tax=unclassified Streptomyces TaxID=2593676 RepID=UPI003246BDE2
MSARRPLLTAASAGVLLCALWFVPSAHTTGDQRSAAPAHPGQRHAAALPAATGRADTTGYVVGGSLFLGLGAASVVYARRTHTG